MVVPAFGSMVTFDPVGVIEEAMEETDRHAAILSISRNISYNLWPDEWTDPWRACLHPALPPALTRAARLMLGFVDLLNI